MSCIRSHYETWGAMMGRLTCAENDTHVGCAGHSTWPKTAENEAAMNCEVSRPGEASNKESTKCRSFGPRRHHVSGHKGGTQGGPVGQVIKRLFFFCIPFTSFSSFTLQLHPKVTPAIGSRLSPERISSYHRAIFDIYLVWVV